MSQKRVFRILILDHLGCFGKGNEPILSPLQAILAPPKSRNALKWDYTPMTRTLPPILTANPLYRYTSHIYFCTPDNVHCLCTQ